MWSFPDIFFFCLVCQPRLLEKKTKKTMKSGKIHVCVLEGHQAELASAELPLSVCLRLQELGLQMSAAQWSTRQTNNRFSVSSGPV